MLLCEINQANCILFYLRVPCGGRRVEVLARERKCPCSDVLEDTVTRQQPTGFSSCSTLWAGMCCAGGRRRWQRAVNTVRPFVYLFAALPRQKKKRRRRSGGSGGRSRGTSVSLRSPEQPCQDTSWRAVVALNQYFPPSRPGLFHWQGFNNGRELNE